MKGLPPRPKLKAKTKNTSLSGLIIKCFELLSKYLNNFLTHRLSMSYQDRINRLNKLNSELSHILSSPITYFLGNHSHEEFTKDSL